MIGATDALAAASWSLAMSRVNALCSVVFFLGATVMALMSFGARRGLAFAP